MRQPPVYERIGAAPLTQEERALIEERQLYLAERFKESVDDYHFHFVSSENVDSRGGLVKQRLLSLCGKAAIIHEGRLLLEYWKEIKREVDIPWNVWFWEIHDTLWTDARIESRIVRTNMDGTETSGGLWTWDLIPNMPAFGVVDETVALHFLGVVGGQLPSMEHRGVRVKPLTLVVSRGEVTEEKIVFLEHGPQPYVYAALDDTSWATRFDIDQSGLVVVVPTTNVAIAVPTSLNIGITDAEGDQHQLAVTIELSVDRITVRDFIAASGSGQVFLGWANETDAVEWQYRVDGGGWTVVPGGNVPAHLVRDLPVGTYVFQVRALNQIGQWGPPSPERTASVQ